jgi:hypothetical protein
MSQEEFTDPIQRMLFGRPDPKTWKPMDWQEGPYLYHGTDSESAKSIQREGMNTGPSMVLTTDTEPAKRLWFAKNSKQSWGFAGRRISHYTTRLVDQEMRRRGIDKDEYDTWTAEEEVTYMRVLDGVLKERADIYPVLFRIREDSIPEDCDVDEPEIEMGELTPEGPKTNIRKPYVILDNCEIPPSLLEVCGIGGEAKLKPED